jgi:hypothetical protein
VKHIVPLGEPTTAVPRLLQCAETADGLVVTTEKASFLLLEHDTAAVRRFNAMWRPEWYAADFTLAGNC